MGDFLHLPQGHLLNISPRQRHGKYSNVSAVEAENVQSGPTTNRGGSPANSGNSDTGTGSQTIMRRTRPGTKLPLPRDFPTKGKEQPKDKQPTSHKHREYSSLGNIRPRKSSTTLHSSPDETIDKDREQYWQKVREKFERQSPTGKIKDHYKEPYVGAYRKIMSLANSPKSEALKQRLKHAGNTTRGSSKTRIASPIIHPRLRPGYNSPGRSDNDATAQLNKYFDGIQRTDSGTDESLLHLYSDKPDNATDSSLNSHTSLSPVSGPSSSLTEWEDRFVVKMPSAKEPNPPTMSAQQITEFQHSIEKVHNEGGAMLDPDSLPSPPSPDDKNTSPKRPDKPTTFDGQDPQPLPKTNDVEDPSSTQPGHPRYYSPDEIGTTRISTIWEETPATKQRKDTPYINPDGSFLGCKEINGTNDKNPDEILLFAPTERPRVVDVSSPMATTPRDRTNFTIQQRRADKEEKATPQEGRKPASPNLKLVQCSKPLSRTMCRDTSCHQVDKLAQTSSQEKSNTHRPTRPPGEKKPTCRDDDVFIITPTITRTMVSMGDIRGHAQKTSVPTPTSRTAGEIITDARAKPQVKPSPLGLRRATQNSQEKSNASSAASSRSVPVRTIAVIKHRAEAGRRKVEPSRDMRGYIRMPSMPQPTTENSTEHAGSKLHQSRASSTGSNIENLHHMKPISHSNPLATASVPNISPIGSIDRGQPGGVNSAPKVTKVVEVAELDGLQVQEFKEPLPRLRITDMSVLSADFPDMEVVSPTKSAKNALTLALIMEILIISAAQMEAVWQRVMSNRHSKTALLKLALNGILEMLEHCLHVLKTWLTAFSTYNVTGTWPRPADQDLAQSVADVCQAVAYLAILCFMMMAVERAAGYIVFVGSWIVWFARPFGWFFVTIGRALLT